MHLACWYRNGPIRELLPNIPGTDEYHEHFKEIKSKIVPIIISFLCFSPQNLQYSRIRFGIQYSPLDWMENECRSIHDERLD